MGTREMWSTVHESESGKERYQGNAVETHTALRIQETTLCSGADVGGVKGKLQISCLCEADDEVVPSTTKTPGRLDAINI